MNERIVREFGTDTVFVLKKSPKANKKYRIIMKFANGTVKTVDFGGVRKNGVPYSQYRDSTGLGFYSEYDNLNLDKRENYFERHGRFEDMVKYSSDYFSAKFLYDGGLRYL